MSLVPERARVWMSLLIGPLVVMVGSSFAVRDLDAFWAIPASLIPGGAYYADAMAHRALAAESVDVVVFGSSVALRDIDEAALSRQLGGASVANLSVNGLPMAGSAMYAPDIVRIQPRLALLVVGVMELDDKPSPVWLKKYHPAVALQVYGPWRMLGDLEGHLDGLLCWLSPIHRHRPGLRRYATRGPHSRPHPRAQDRLPDSRMAAQINGVRGRYQAGAYQGVGPNAEGLRAIHRRLTEAGIPLVVSPAPIHPAIAPELYPAPLLRLLDGFAQAGVDVLPASALGVYADGDFVDPLHLGPRAQRRYTRKVAAQLWERLD